VCLGTKEFLSRYGFAYVDHSLTDPAVRPRMTALAQGRRGIPVIDLDGAVTVGFDRRWLKERLGLY
jgi:glutaredoxin